MPLVWGVTGVCRFWERRPGYALTAALIVATGTSTLFSLFWPFPPDEAKQLNMSHLADGGLGALFVWCYVLLWYVVLGCFLGPTAPPHPILSHLLPHPMVVVYFWVRCCVCLCRFLVQDIAKVVTYWLMAKLNVGQQHEVDVRLVSGKIRAAIDTENRNDRIRGTALGLPLSCANSTPSQPSQSSQPARCVCVWCLSAHCRRWTEPGGVLHAHGGWRWLQWWQHHRVRC